MSLGWVTTGAATQGVTPLFFPQKPGDLFLVATSAVSSLFILSVKTDDLAFLARHHCHCFTVFTRVSPPWKVSPRTFLPDRTHFSNILCKFSHKKFAFGCHPPLRVSPGEGPPPVTLLFLIAWEIKGKALYKFNCLLYFMYIRGLVLGQARKIDSNISSTPPLMSTWGLKLQNLASVFDSSLFEARQRVWTLKHLKWALVIIRRLTWTFYYYVHILVSDIKRI